MNHSKTATDYQASVNTLICLPLKLQSLQQSSSSFQIFGLTNKWDTQAPFHTLAPDSSMSSTRHPHGAFTAMADNPSTVWSSTFCSEVLILLGAVQDNAAALWQVPRGTPAAFQTTSDTQGQRSATCLRHSSTAWTS